MNQPITVHIIANAHIDPVWLWPWQAGVDEVLATGRTMCDLLDRYPEFIFTAGEAWRYWQIERIDPALFARIKQHVAGGRWALVGGWWVQPDCNFPSGFGFERQIETGKRYFLDRFGVFPQVAYNVDSFGHAASLPGYMHAAGQRYYVMMRPQEHEMALPARLFRWHGTPDGPEIITFRIAGGYGTWGEGLPADHLRNAMSALPEGITHTMCFVGMGDHGGGPSAQLIEMILAHTDAGCRLVFSSPERFFHAISEQSALLPVVTGELQYHAIGCYSVQRGIKTRLRRAEHLLRQAELAGGDDAAPRLADAWQMVAFNQFHDILGGTSIPSAYRQQYDQLGAAAAIADELLQTQLRQKLLSLPDDPLQRMVLQNPSDAAYDGYAEHEPWMRSGWQPGYRLLDEAGQDIPYQTIQAESVNGWITRLLFPVHLDPGALRVVRIDPHGTPNASTTSRVQVSASKIGTDQGVAVELGLQRSFTFPGDVHLPLPHLDLLDDRTDNWSHSVDRYPEGPVTSPRWEAPCVLDAGPLMAALLQTGRVGDSALRAEWRVYADVSYIELRLTVHWRERNKLLKMLLPFPAPVYERLDGIPGAALRRENSGCERPLRDWSRFMLAPEMHFGVVCPDVYALDATSWRARLTLLRSPLLTHHDPNLGMAPRGIIADQGEHDFLFRFFCGAAVTPELLEQHSLMLHRPLLAADLTRGMP